MSIVVREREKKRWLYLIIFTHCCLKIRIQFLSYINWKGINLFKKNEINANHPQSCDKQLLKRVGSPSRRKSDICDICIYIGSLTPLTVHQASRNVMLNISCNSYSKASVRDSNTEQPGTTDRLPEQNTTSAQHRVNRNTLMQLESDEPTKINTCHFVWKVWHFLFVFPLCFSVETVSQQEVSEGLWPCQVELNHQGAI